MVDQEGDLDLGLSLLNDRRGSLRESSLSKKRTSVTSQRQKASASITTQKTTLPQIETITDRDQVYQVKISSRSIGSFIFILLQKYKELLNQMIADIERECSSVLVDLDRHQSFWNSSIAQLQSLRIS